MTTMPSKLLLPLSPCGEVLLGEVCGHGRGCPPPEVTLPANPTVERYKMVDGRLQRVEASR